MNFSNVVVDSLYYPFNDLKRFFILLILFLTSFLLVPMVIGLGYMWRIIENTLKGNERLPDFSNINQLFVNGLKILVVQIIYSIPTFLVLYLLSLIMNININLAVLTELSNNPSYVFILIFVGLFVGFFVNIVLVIGFGNMVHENRLMAVFDFKKIFQLIKIIGWKNYLIYIIIYTLIGALIMLHSSLTALLNTNPGNIALSVFLIMNITQNICKTYSAIFASRFKGLVYPIKEIETV
ncbi:MAG: DUF4013 domain-containing protein [Methanobacterium sp.]|nr:DUF4013 domain-containing protein [Methanobacterium sp.]